MSEAYLRTDEREDLIASLKLVRLSLQQCALDSQYWKWVLIGAHASLQAAIVFHLSFGNNLLVAKLGHAHKWLDAHREHTAYPDMHMDYFMDLYRKSKTQEILGFRLATTQSQDCNVDRLLDFRNAFIHFMPKGWSIELAGLPGICMDSLNIVEGLAQGPIESRWESDLQRSEFAELLFDCITLLRNLRDADSG